MSGVRARGVAGAAGLIAAVTVLARLAGFARTAVFVQTVGAGCVGSVYTTANTAPNILFDIVAGGMLAALVVPVLAPALAAGDTVRARQALAALLGWTLLVTSALALALGLLAPLLLRALLPASGCAGAVALGTRMLQVFAPQVVFYGLGAVLGGALQAGRRFGWPAAAPLLSSLVVVAAYAAYGAQVPAGVGAAGVPRAAELTLSVGTTAGVVVLAACLLPPALRAGLRPRLSLRFPPGLAPVARRTAIAGAAALAAQQVANAVMLRLANDGTTAGLAVVVTLAQTVFLLPWAVLAVPVATAGYPGMATAWDGGDRAGWAGAVRRSARLVLAAAAAGTAALVAVAEPAGALLLSGRRTGGAARAEFAPALAGFAVGLLGWALVALLARALYAAGAVRAAGAGQVAGQLVVVAADLALAALTPAGDRALVLGLGNAAGVTVAAGWLAVAAARRGAPLPVPSLLGAVGAAGVGALGGWVLGRQARGAGPLAALAWGVPAGLVALALAGAAALTADPAVRAQLAGRVRARTGSAR